MTFVFAVPSNEAVFVIGVGRRAHPDFWRNRANGETHLTRRGSLIAPGRRYWSRDVLNLWVMAA